MTLYYIKYRNGIAEPMAWLYSDKKKKIGFNTIDDAMLKIQELIVTSDKHYVIVDEDEVMKSLFYTSKSPEDINGHKA